MHNAQVTPRDSKASARVLFALVVLLVVLLAGNGEAAITSIEPPAPTNQDAIRATLTFNNPGCNANFVNTSVSGSVIRTEIILTNCAFTPAFPVSRTAVFGPLPRGTYTYEFYLVLGGVPSLDSQRTIVVADAPPPVPTLEPLAVVLLATMIAAIGAAVLRLK